MKNLKKGKEIRRVSEATAQDRDKLKALLELGWNYCPNNEWRAYRDAKAKKKVSKKKVPPTKGGRCICGSEKKKVGKKKVGKKK